MYNFQQQRPKIKIFGENFDFESEFFFIVKNGKSIEKLYRYMKYFDKLLQKTQKRILKTKTKN